VVWFGEMLPVTLLQKAEAAAAQCEVFFSIGTSSLVYPAAELPFTALRGGATVVEINPQPTPLSDYVAYTLQGAAGKVLPVLLKAVWDSEVPQ
jgi:NAD-dependent deacetylase